MILTLSLAGAFIWLAILLVPWRPWSTRERLDDVLAANDVDLNDVTVLIPARNEASSIGRTLEALACQGRALEVIVIDDRSTDGTAETVRRRNMPGTSLIEGEPLPAGWSGKVWALEQGRAKVERTVIVLLDADIELSEGVLVALRERMRESELGLASLMAELPMQASWAKLLNPAFVFFFKLLYPFHLSNSPRAPVAAAAGGCVMVRSRVLDDIGGFGDMRWALIDDCALAKLVKSRGHRTWVGLTRKARSLRPCTNLSAVWNMVARSAFTQLRYSLLWLIACTLLMIGAFAGPTVGLYMGTAWERVAAATGLGAMWLSYLPTLRYYDRSGLWALAMPLIGSLYLAMTWHSALRYWCGSGSNWKGRHYGRAPDGAADAEVNSIRKGGAL